MDAPQTALAFVQHVVLQVCDDKEAAKVELIHDDRGYLVTVKVSDADMGRVIGRNGQTISAIRLLTRSIGAKHGQKITLKVIEPNE